MRFLSASKIWMVFSTLFLLGTLDNGFTQDYTHPERMALSASSFARPDPKSHRVRLNNGLVAYIVEEHRAPLITLSAYIKSGTADDNKPGSAEALVQSLRSEGTREMPGPDFRNALQGMAAVYSVDMSPEQTVISLNVPQEDGKRALALLASLVRQCNVSAEVIATLRSQAGPGEEAKSAINSYEGSLDLAVAKFNETLFAGHAYGESSSAADYEVLTPDDVQRFHARFFVPGNVVLALSGDFALAEMTAAMRDEFGDWPKKSVPKARKAKKLQPAKARRVFTYPSDKLQAWMVLGHELPQVPENDQAALQVMNYVLGGGHFDTRLFRETRDKRGLTNDDSGFLEPNDRGPGSYTFRTYGRPEVIHLLLELTLKEIDRIRAEEVSDEELRVAKGALAEGVFEMQFENGHATARTFAEEWLVHGNHKETARYVSRIQSVTKKDVLKAARKYLHPERMQVVLVGPIETVQQSRYPEGNMRVADFGEMVTGR